MTSADAASPGGQLMLEQAQEAAGRGEYDRASALYSRLIGNRDPILHVAGLLGLADSRYRLDDDEGALQAWIVATQAPETPLSWQAWVALAGARVREGDLVGATRAYREAEARAPAEERAAIASRLGWLNKELGNTSTAGRYFGRARPQVFTPVSVWAVLAITIAVSAWTLLSTSGEQIYQLLALDKQLVLEGEYWRLLTVTLVHGNPIHLLFNMFALYIAGPLVEALYGRLGFLAIYLLSAAAGSVASFLFFPGVSVGASGAIFGLFGLLFVATYVHRPAIGRNAAALTTQIGILIAINLAIGFGVGGVAQIDNAAHVGGLLAGAWLGFVVAPRGGATLRQGGVRAIAGIALVVAAVVVGLLIPPMWA